MFAPALREEYRQWRSEMMAEVAADRRPNRYLAAQLRLNSDAGIPTNWEILAPLGVRRHFPFHTREMLEHAAGSDIRAMMGPGPKRILRAALAGDVPADLLLREDKGQWEGWPSAPRREQTSPISREAVEALLDPAWERGSGQLDLLEREAMRYLLQMRSAG
jgi:hypothetical protein